MNILDIGWNWSKYSKGACMEVGYIVVVVYMGWGMDNVWCICVCVCMWCMYVYVSVTVCMQSQDQE